jgi:hypothetical protein
VPAASRSSSQELGLKMMKRDKRQLDRFAGTSQCVVEEEDGQVGVKHM